MSSTPVINRLIAWGFKKDDQRRIVRHYRQIESSLRRWEAGVLVQLHPWF